MFNLKKLTKIFAALVISLLIVTSIVIAINSNSVRVEFVASKKVDVILTKSKTGVDLTNFKEDLYAKLAEKGIERGSVNIILEDEGNNTINQVNWTLNGLDAQLGNIAVQNNNTSTNVQITGNEHLGGKNVIYNLGENNISNEISFDYNCNFGDSIDQAGLLVGITKNSETVQVTENVEGNDVTVDSTVEYLSGYIISFNNRAGNSDKFATYASLWKCDRFNVPDTENIVEDATKITDLAISESGTLSVKVTPGQIVITGGDLSSPYTYNVQDYCGSGFGFYAAYFEHNCEHTGEINFNNFELNQYNAFDLGTALNNNLVNENSEKIIVNVSDFSNSNLIDNNLMNDILAKIQNKQAHFIGWGTNENKNEMENLIRQNQNKGLFTYNTNYSQSIEDTAEYIRALISAANNTTNYVLVNEEINVNVTPESLKENTTDSQFQNGSWKVEHDYNYFENNQGQYEKSGVYTDGIITNFPKVGKYTLSYKNEDVAEVFVHRKPIADFTFEIDENNVVTLTNTSVDDDSSNGTNGISEEKWSYKVVGESNWQNRRLLTIDPTKSYIVKLEVKDYQETWSDVTKIVSLNSNPVADFKFKENTVSFYKKLEIIDKSYDPSGKTLTKYEYYILDEDGNQIYYAEEPLLKCMDIGIGKFTMGLRVTNSEGAESEDFTQNFEIVDDTTAPRIIATPTEKRALNEKINVILKFADDESGFSYYKYVITQNDEVIMSDNEWSDEIHKAVDSIEIKNPNARNYIHVIAVDNAGNASDEQVFGPYEYTTNDFALEIRVKDDNNPGVNIAGAKFALVHPKTGTPDERIIISEESDYNGVCTIYGKKMDAGTYEYILQEETAPTGYDNVGLALLNITFDSNGEIVNVTKKYNTQYELVRYDTSKIEIDVKTAIDGEFTDGFSVQLDVVDSSDGTIQIEGAKYKIIEKAETGEKRSLTDTTNPAGRIKLRKQFAGSGEIVLYLQHIESAGYLLDAEEKVVVLQRSATDGSMRYIDWKSSPDLDVVVNGDTVEIVHKIQRKAVNNVLKIKAVDAIDNDSALGNIEVNIINPLTGVVDVQTMPVDGLLEYPITAPGVGTYVYNIAFRNIPGEYVVPSTTKIEVSFDGFGNIESIAEVNTNNCIKVEKTSVETKQDITNVGNIVVGLERSDAFNPYTINFTNIDLDDNSLRVDGVEYVITVNNGASSSVVTKTTDVTGKFRADISCNVNSIIQIQQVATKKGYILDKDLRVITFELDASNNMDVKDFSPILDVQMNKSKKEIIVIDKSVQKINAPGNKGNITFYITKRDRDFNYLANVGVKIHEIVTDTIVEGHTDDYGMIVLPDFPVPDVGEYEFHITETSFVPGYDGETTEIVLNLNYELFEGQLDCSSQIVKKGEKYIENKKFDQYETDTTYQLDVSFDLINSLLGDNADPAHNFKVDIDNIDKVTGDEFSGGRYKFWLKYDNGTSMYKGEKEIVDGFELNSLGLYAGTTVMLQEVEKPLGYDADDTIHEIEIGEDENGQVYIVSATDKLIASIEKVVNVDNSTSNVLKIGVIRNRIIKPFELRIITLPEIDPVNLVVSDIKYNLKVDGKEYGDQISDNKGVATFPDVVAIKNFSMTLTEVDVPLGYNKDTEVKTIKMFRDEANYDFQCISTDSNIQVSDVNINNQDQIITITITKDQDQKIKLKNVDGDNTSIVLEDAEFEITSTHPLHSIQDVFSGTDGFATAVYDRPVKGVVTYTIKETAAPLGYNIGTGRTCYLKLEYDDYGRIVSSELYDNSQTKVCEWAEIYLPKKYQLNPVTGNYELVSTYNKSNEITILVKNSNKYKFILEKIDNRDMLNGGSAIDITGAEFYIKIKTPEGETEYNRPTYDGKIELDNLDGIGEIEITAKETHAAYGYDLIDDEYKIVFNRQNDSNEMVLNTEKTTANLADVTIDNDNQYVKLTVINESEFNIGIKAVDALTGEALAGARFEIRNDLQNTDTQETDANGELVASVGRAERSKVVTYVISQVVAPTGYTQPYNLIEDIVVEVTFGADGNVEQYNVVRGGVRVKTIENPMPSLSLTSTISSNFDMNELNLEITQGETDAYLIKVIAENENVKSVRIPYVTYQAVGVNPDGLIQFNHPSIQTGDYYWLNGVKMTDKYGLFKLEDVDIKNNFKLHIEEVETADGYSADPDEIEVTFNATFSEIGKKLISCTNTDPRVTVEIDNINNIIEVHIAKVPNQVGVVINKKDFDDHNISLGGAEFTITERGTTNSFTGSTDNSGKGYISLPIKPEGTYVYDVVETTAPKGYYKSIDMALEVSYFDNKVSSAVVAGGTDVIEITNTAEKQIDVNIYDREKDKTVETYSIELIRANEKDLSEHIVNSKNNIVVENSLYATVSREDYTNANGHIYFANSVKTFGDTTISINETEVAEGYIWDSRNIIIDIVRDEDAEKIKVTGVQGMPSKNVEIDHANKLIKITITNNKTQVLVDTKKVVTDPFKIIINTKTNSKKLQNGVWVKTTVPVHAYYDMDVYRDPENVASTWIKTGYYYKNLQTEKYQFGPFNNWNTHYWDPWRGQWLYPWIETGTFSVGNMYGDGNINIDLFQTGVDKGYIEVPEQNIIVHRNQETGELTVVQDGTDVKTTVDSFNHTITIDVVVEPTITINFEDRDKENNSIKLDSVNIQVFDGTKTYNTTTDVNGEGSVVLTGLEANTSYAITITQPQMDNGYKPIEPVVLNITTNDNGKLAKYSIGSGQGSGEIYLPEEVYHYWGWGNSNSLQINRDAYKNAEHIKILLNNTCRFQTEVTVLDSVVTTLPVENAMFELTVTDDNGNDNKYLGDGNTGTDVNGKQTFSNIIGKGTVTVHYKQISTNDSYKFDDTIEGDIILVKDPVTYGLVLDSFTGPITNVHCDSQEGILYFDVYNEKALKLIINKTDIKDTSIKLQGAVFKVTAQATVMNGQYVTDDQNEEVVFENLVTDRDGIVKVDFGTPVENSRYIVKIEEVTPPVGYNPIGEIILKVYTDVNRDISSASPYGTSRLKCNVSGKSVINADITNGTFKTNGNGDNLIPYSLEIKAQDDYVNKPIENLEYSVKMYQNDVQIKDITITTLVDLTKAIQEGIASLTGLTADGTIKFVISEKTLPEGYKNSNKEDTLYFTCEYKNADDYVITKDLVPYIIYDAENSTLPETDVVVDNDNKTIRINYTKEPTMFLNIKTALSNTSSLSVLPRMTYRVTSYEEGNSSVSFANLSPSYDEAEINDIINNYMVKSSLEVEKKTGLSGELTFDVGKPIPNKTIVYVIEQLNGDGNYVETTKIGVKFDSKGTILDYFILADNMLVDIDPTDNYLGMSHINLNILIDEDALNGNNGRDVFALNINKVYDMNHNVKIDSTEFTVDVYNSNGDKVDDYVKTTDKNGNVKIENIPLREERTIKITETAAKDGFIADTVVREFTVDNRSDGTLKMVSQSDNLRNHLVSDGINRVVNIDFENSIDGIGFVLENVDSTDVTWLVSDGEFEIIDDEIYAGGAYTAGVDSLRTTGIDRFTVSNGAGFIVFPAKNEGTHTFTINQISAPAGYKLQTETVKIDVTYNANKEVVDAIVSKGYYVAAVADVKNNYIGLTYLNEQNELPIGPYTLSIIKVDENDKDIVLAGAEFEVTIQNELGVTAQINKTGVTNIDGDLTISGINGAGLIRVDLKETVAPDNYLINSKDLFIEFTRDVDTGKLLLVDQSNLDAILESNRNKVTVYVADKLDENLFNLAINKVDEAGNPVISNFTRFKVGEENETPKVYATNASGKIMVNNLHYPEQDGVVVYTIQEVQAPIGYKKIEDEMKVAITFETPAGADKKSIANIAVVEGNQITEGTYKDDYVEFNVVNKVGSLFIEKQDSKDNLLKVVGTTFEITNEATNDVVTAVTNSDGLADVDLEVGTYTIVEKQPTVGFVANTDTIRLQVTTDSNNKKQYTLLSGTADLVAEGKSTKLCIRNAQEVMTLSPYSIEVIKVDKDDDEIGLKDAQLRLNITNQNGAAKVTKTDVTNENGVISINELYGSGEIDISLSELKAPRNRKVDAKERNIKLYRDETTGEIECDIDAGLEVVIEGNNVKIYFANEYNKDFYSLALQKVDEQGNKIKNDGFVFELSNEDMTDVRAIQANENGKLIINDLVMPSIEKDETYYLQEIYGIDGYDVITDRIKIVLQFRQLNGLMKLVGAYSDNKDYIQAKKITGTYALLNVINAKEERSKFILEKVDSADNMLKIPDVEFDVKNLATNDVKRIKADKDGRISIPIETPDTDVSFSITEVTTDAGFDAAGEFKVTARYDSLQEKTTVSKLTFSSYVKIDTSSSIPKVMVENTQQPVANIGAYKIVVVKHDKDEIDLVKQRALFRIDVANEYGVKKENKTDYTDDNGKITINEMNGYGDIAITIQERKQPADYEYNGVVRTVNLYRDEYKGTIEFESGDEISEDNVEINNKEKTVTIYIPNKLMNEKYNFVIESLGENNQLLRGRGASYEVTEVETGITHEYVAGESGKAIIHKIDMPSDQGSVNYKIKQKVAPIGYVLRDDKEINVEVKFKRLNGVMSVIDIIIDDTSYIKYNKVSKQLVNVGFLNIPMNDLYLGSTVYVVDNINIKEVEPHTKVYDFMGNLFTNGTLTIYNTYGDELDLSNADLEIEEGYKVKAEKGTDSIEKIVMLKKPVIIDDDQLHFDPNTYVVEDLYIDRIAPNTNIVDFIDNLNTNGNVTITDTKGNVLDNEDSTIIIGSGVTVNIEKNGTIIEKTAIVTGDYNGDGVISISDVSVVNKYFLGGIPESEYRTRICDVTGDGVITISDVSKLNRYYLGLIPKLV